VPGTQSQLSKPGHHENIRGDQGAATILCQPAAPSVGHWLIPSRRCWSSDAMFVGANKTVDPAVSVGANNKLSAAPCLSRHRHNGQYASSDATSGLIHEDSDTGTKASMSVPFYHLALGPCTGVLGCRPRQSAEVQQSAANGCSPTESGRRSLLMSCPGQASNSKCNCYRVMPRLGTPLGPTDKPCIMGTPSPSSRRP
jgi:hypothetical protein